MPGPIARVFALEVDGKPMLVFEAFNASGVVGVVHVLESLGQDVDAPQMAGLVQALEPLACAQK